MTTSPAAAPKSNQPYTQQEIDLILSLVPTDANAATLASALGRSVDAISLIYKAAYSGQWLKRLVEARGTGDDVFDKIARAKKRSGILVGYEP